MTNELGPLRTIALEEGDVDLFPDVVLRLHDRGSPWTARVRLVELSAAEQDPARKARQRHYAEEPLLWMIPVRTAPARFRLNGFGLWLYRGPPRSDQTYRVIHWLTALFVPVMPLGAYVVRRQLDDDGFQVERFLGQIPVPLSIKAVPMAWAAAVAAVAIPLAWHALTHAELVAYNGFGVPLEVSVGAERFVLAPGGHRRFPGLPTEEIAVAAFAPDGQVFDSEIVDLGPHAGELAVYNVAARGVVGLDWVRYTPDGSSEAPEGELLPPVSISFLDEVPDHVFEAPPAQREISGGASWIDERVLVGKELPPTPFEAWTLLCNIGEPARGLAVIDAELRLSPDDVSMIRVGGIHRARFLPDEAAHWISGHRSRRPEEIALHELYQDMVPIPPDVMVAEYDALLAASPDSPMLRTLAGRLRKGTPEAGVFYADALAREPDYLPALRALADWQLVAADWAAADASFARIESVGAPEEVWKSERLRLARILGRPDVAQSGELVPPEQIALIAGDLERVRAMLRSATEPSVTSLLLASSDGATDEDRTFALGQLPPPDSMPNELLVLGWVLVNRLDPASRTPWDRALAGTGPGHVFPGVLSDPAGMTDPARIDVLVERQVNPSERGAIYAAMAILVPDGPAGAEYRKRARRFQFPGESPWFRP